MPGRDGSQEEGRGEGRKKREGEEGRAKMLEQGRGQREEERGRPGRLQGERGGMQEAEWREGVRGRLERGVQGRSEVLRAGSEGRRRRPGRPEPAARYPPEPQLRFSPGASGHPRPRPPRGGPWTHFLTRPRPLLKGPARPASALKPQPARNSLQSQARVRPTNRLSAPVHSPLGDGGWGAIGLCGRFL